MSTEKKSAIEDIIYALRCSNDEENKYKCKGKECPYWTMASQEEIRRFREEHGDGFKDDFFEGCACGQLGRDAADIMEHMWNTMKKMAEKTADLANGRT